MSLTRDLVCVANLTETLVENQCRGKIVLQMLTQMSHFPGKNLSGTLVAYIIAPIMYRAPISAIHPTDA